MKDKKMMQKEQQLKEKELDKVNGGRYVSGEKMSPINFEKDNESGQASIGKRGPQANRPGGGVSR